MVKNRWNSSAKKKWFQRDAEKKEISKKGSKKKGTDNNAKSNSSSKSTTEKKVTKKATRTRKRTSQGRPQPLNTVKGASERTTKRKGRKKSKVPAFAPPSPTRTAAARAACAIAKKTTVKIVKKNTVRI